MWRDPYRAELRSEGWTKIRATLAYAAVAGVVAVASAVSGATVALHLAGPAAAPYRPRPSVAATASPIASSPMLTPATAAELPAPQVQIGPTAAAIAPAADAASAPAPTARPASPPIAERELTFAWGYAQRHPGASAHQPDPRLAAAFASAASERTAAAAKKHPGRPPQRRQPAPQREGAGFASAMFPTFDREPHQALDYADDRRLNGSGVFTGPQPPSRPRLRNASQPSRHETTRS